MSDRGPRDYLLAPKELLTDGLASFDATLCFTLAPAETRALKKILKGHEFSYVSPATQRRTAIFVARADDDEPVHRFHAFIAYKNTDSPYDKMPLATIREIVKLIDKSKGLAMTNYSEIRYLDHQSGQVAQSIAGLRNLPVVMAGRMASFTGVHLVTNDTPPVRIAYHWTDQRTVVTTSIGGLNGVPSVREALRTAHRLVSLASPAK